MFDDDFAETMGQKRVARVITFADEIKPNPPTSHWAYFAIVSVLQADLKTALERLEADRKEIDYHYEIGWSDIERPGKNARPGKKELLATNWLKRVVNEHDIWRFSVLGMDTSQMVMEAFGAKRGDQIANSYRRFYRANLKHHVGLYLHAHDEANVVKTYHDAEGRLEADEWFAWHPQAVVSQRQQINFAEQKVTFINSCHRKEEKHSKASHFIQLCDVLVGATRYLFEDLGNHEAKDRAVQPLVPLMTRLNSSKEHMNKNSSYKHVGRATLGFFPSRALMEHELDDEFARGQSGFFRDRQMAQQKRLSGQGDLFEL